MSKETLVAVRAICMFDFVLIFDSAFLYPISFHWPLETQPYAISGLYYNCVTIVIDPPSVVKVTLQIVASLMIVIEDARLRLS
jgi:hypothetical protein